MRILRSVAILQMVLMSTPSSNFLGAAEETKRDLRRAEVRPVSSNTKRDMRLTEPDLDKNAAPSDFLSRFSGLRRGDRQSDGTIDVVPFELELHDIISVHPRLKTKKSVSPADVSHRSSRRSLQEDASIAAALNEALGSGVEHPRFVIISSYDDDGNSFTDPEPFAVNVIMTAPSVTEATFFSVDGGPSKPVGSSSIRYLVADPAFGAQEFAILAVDLDDGSVRGLVQKDSRLVTLEQDDGGPVVVKDAVIEPRDWKCFTEGHNQHNHTVPDPIQVASQLGIEADVQNRRRSLQTQSTSHQVDLYLEVDTPMVNFHDPNDPDNMPNTIAYLNALITGISRIYEVEIDTHLHVMHIAKTNIYDNINGDADESGTSKVLNEAKRRYGSDATWHYINPVTGQPPDLHHVIMRRALGGGRATLNVICNPADGFGVSTGIIGSLTNGELPSSMYWDYFVVAHEIGHNFGSGHTHDGYDPMVDSCGLLPRACTGPIDGQNVSTGDATIMSYCHLCEGGSENIAFTFGGVLADKTLDSGDISNWKNTNEWSLDPRRVSKTMQNVVSAKGTCVERITTTSASPTSSGPTTLSPAPTSGSPSSPSPVSSSSPTSLVPNTVSPIMAPTSISPSSAPTTQSPIMSSFKPTPRPSTVGKSGKDQQGSKAGKAGSSPPTHGKSGKSSELI